MNQPIILRPDQQQLKQGVYNGWNVGNKNMLAVLPTGGGKCLGKNTPVLMFDGNVKMSQNIAVGDIAMGPDSAPRFVKSICSGLDNLYKITPNKGDPYIVNSKHILSLRRTTEYVNPKYPCHMKSGEIVNISVEEYLTKSKYFKHIHKGWRTGVEFNKPISIDPYWLGLWLGDGTSRTPAITTMDSEIEEYLIDFAKSLNMRVSKITKPNNKASTFNIVQKDVRARKSTPLTRFLRENNLVLNKHIPHHYKTSSRKDRLKLLAGILDSDGHYDGKGYDINLKSEKLLDDVIFIARSLGFSAYKKPNIKICTNNGSIGVYWRCCMYGDIDKIPCRIKRKKARPRKQKKDVTNVGIKVTPEGVGEYYGFEVIGNDRLFLLGDFTVTHNSVVMSDIVLDKHNLGHQQIVMAHRTELVSQMSIHIARRGIKHRIIAPKKVVGQVIREHRREFNGFSFVNPSANCSVGGVDTILSRSEELQPWAEQQDHWYIDEAHHVISDNKWGKCVNLFPRSLGLGVTATPERADGQGLGIHADGVFHDMVVGPTMRELIDLGALCDYEIVIPESDFRIDDDLPPSGDYSPKKMREASKKSHIVGDVVNEYIKYAYGKQVIVFATDVETSNEIAKNFNLHGIRAASVSAKTPPEVRSDYIRRFRNGELTVLVNVDLFGEGFDVPAVEVVIMARPTASLAVYLQQFGRVLRVLAGKPFGLLIDHVSNWKRHGFPDKPRLWALDRRDKRAKKEIDPEDIPLTVCKNCSKPYERFFIACPHCGHVPEITMSQRGNIEQVDGDLILLDRKKLDELRAAVDNVPLPAEAGIKAQFAGGAVAGNTAVKRSIERHQSKARLENSIAQWAGIQRFKGRSDRESHKRFYIAAKIDVLSALAQPRVEMDALADKIESWIKC